MSEEFAKIINKYIFGEEKIFFAPRIPEAKLANAVKAYAPAVKPADVLVLLDETVWGSAKDGLLLAKQGLFCHEMLTAPGAIPLYDIQNIHAQKKDIYVNKIKFFGCTVLDKEHIEPFGKMLGEIVDLLQGKCGTATEAQSSEAAQLEADIMHGDASSDACSAQVGTMPQADQTESDEPSMTDVEACEPENIVEQPVPLVQEQSATVAINQPAATAPNTTPEAEPLPESPQVENKTVRPVSHEELRDIFANYYFKDQKIYFYPNIPQAKLVNAISAYAPTVSPEDVIILQDDTLMGGSKEGILLTYDRIFFHELFSPPVSIALADIKSIAPIEGNKLKINGKNVYKSNMIDSKYFATFTQLLENTIDVLAAPYLDETEVEGRRLIKELKTRNEYFFCSLYKSIPKKIKIERASNIIDDIADFVLPGSPQDEGAQANTEAARVLKKRMAIAAFSLLRIAFNFSQLIAKRCNKETSLSLIGMSDGIIHEMLIYMLFRGVKMLEEAFYGETQKRFIGAYISMLMEDELLKPFYRSKIEKMEGIRLKKAALRSHLEQFSQLVIAQRNFFYDICTDAEASGEMLHNVIRYSLIGNDAQCVLDLEEVSDVPEFGKQTLLGALCMTVGYVIQNEIIGYLEQADNELEKVLERLFADE